MQFLSAEMDMERGKWIHPISIRDNMSFYLDVSAKK